MQSSSSSTKEVKDVKASNAITKSNHKSTALKAPRGNFVNYYAIRRDVQQCGVIKDRRVSSIIEWINCHRIVEGIQCRKIERYLDVGCNNGQIMFELANLLQDQPNFLIGVDVDEDLIQKASEEAKRRGYKNNFTENAPLGSGRIGYSASQPRKRIRLDSSDLKFCALTVLCEWTNLESSDKNRQIILDQNMQGYDLITALSITKWIQLSYSDFGLKRFFARVCTSLRPGGIFILEPQPFKSYKNLHKITKPESQERNNLKNMNVYPDDFPWILCVELGLKGPFTIQQRGQDGFLRDLVAFLQPLEVTECFISRRKALLASANSTDDMDIPWVGRNRDSCF